MDLFEVIMVKLVMYSEQLPLADLGGVPGARPTSPKSPDSFISIYKIFET